MKITVHYPKSKQGRQELMKKVAEVHSLGIKSYIQGLPCNKEEKLKILKDIFVQNQNLSIIP